MYCHQEDDESSKNVVGVEEVKEIQNLIQKSEGSRPLGNLNFEETIILK
jgi:hypothetical protein